VTDLALRRPQTLRKKAIAMGNRSYLQITIDDSPAKRRRVGKRQELLASGHGRSTG
jgi:hypothetical protein